MSGSERDVDIDLRQLVVAMARNWRRILLAAAVGTTLAILYVMTATPKYLAETRLIIEPQESIFTRPRTVTATEGDRAALNDEYVQSQVEIIGSTRLLADVAEKLGLDDRSEFGGSDPSMLSRFLMIVGLRSDEEPVNRSERIVREMRERVTIYRVDKTNVIVVQFASRDPKLSADVANELGAAYLAEQRRGNVRTTSDAAAWLEPEIADLREKVKAAEAKVAQFRGQSDLLVGQNNSVLATQQLAELSTELSRVRANRAAAEATAEGVRAALADGSSLDSLPEVLSSGLVQRLREREVQLKADIADLSATLLDNHPRIRALRSQLADLQSQIRAEVRRVLTGLETEARNAKLREAQLTSSLNTLKGASAQAGEDSVELRALEREAAVQRDLLEAYLGRYREAAAREAGSYAPGNARILSDALEPSRPIFPKPVPIVGAAFVGSLLLAGIATMLAELFSGRAMRPAPGSPMQMAPVAPASATPAATRIPPRAVGSAAAAARIHGTGLTRALFVSPAGDAGAVASIIVARRLAEAGRKTILMDLTSGGAVAGPTLDGERLPGITDLLASSASLAEVVQVDRYSDCDVIPAGMADPEKAMRAIERLPIVLQSLETSYDVVVIECGDAPESALRRLLGLRTAVFVSGAGSDEDTIAASLAALSGIPAVSTHAVTVDDEDMQMLAQARDAA